MRTAEVLQPFPCEQDYPNVSSHRVGIFRTTQNVVVKSTLPKPPRQLIAEKVAGRLFPLRYKSHHIGSRVLSFYENVDMIRHHAKRVDKNPHRRGNTFQGFHGSSGAIGIVENGTAILAANGNEINPSTNIFVASKTNIPARNKVHWLRW